MGSLEDVKAALASVFPEPTWLDAWAGLADGDGWTVEINVRVGQPVREIVLRIGGSGGALEAVKHLCNDTGWRAIDLEGWNFVA